MSIPLSETLDHSVSDQLSGIRSSRKIEDIHGKVMGLVAEHLDDLERFPLTVARRELSENGRITVTKADTVPGLPLQLEEMGDGSKKLTVITVGGLYRAPVHNVGVGNLPFKYRPLLESSVGVEHDTPILWRNRGDIALAALSRFAVAMRRNKVREVSLRMQLFLQDVLPAKAGLEKVLRIGAASGTVNDRVCAAGYALDMMPYLRIVQGGKDEEEQAILVASALSGEPRPEMTAAIRVAGVLNQALFGGNLNP